jgi:hypothetical protein
MLTGLKLSLIVLLVSPGFLAAVGQDGAGSSKALSTPLTQAQVVQVLTSCPNWSEDPRAHGERALTGIFAHLKVLIGQDPHVVHDAIAEYLKSGSSRQVIERWGTSVIAVRMVLNVPDRLDRSDITFNPFGGIPRSRSRYALWPLEGEGKSLRLTGESEGYSTLGYYFELEWKHYLKVFGARPSVAP